jgi:cysteinyl-tRNA synthetase, unknown class
VLNVTRRAVVAGLLLAAGGVRSRADAVRPLPLARQQSRDALMKVNHWGCQYQNVDLDSIARSDLDLIVVDSSLDDRHRRFVSPAECRAIQERTDGSRRMVLAYLSVGEVDTKRWYWPDAWRENAPAWVGAENPKWPGSRSVQYWNSSWQALLYAGRGSILDSIMDAGFDGVFLDRVDGYGDWGSTAAALDAMAALVAAIGERARRRKPGFILVMQNAEHILHHAKLLDAIDAHSKESLLTGVPTPDALNRQDDVDWSLSYLLPLQQLGIPTFATEYITELALRDQIRQRLIELGFKPFFGTPSLDHLPSLDVISWN